MRFFDELKRRNVFRVAGVYAVIGWLLAQAAGVLENALNLPGWFDTVIVSALLIGFPVALVLAWAFELTPEGMRLTANVAEGESIAPKTGRKLDYAILGGIALIAVMFVVDRLTPSSFVTPAAAPPQGEGESLHPEEASARSGEAVTKDASIAVLPFADLSPGKDQEYFSDGMAEEILNVLANVPGLSIASRTSSFQFKGREIGIPEIARQLNVRHILEGSVRKAGTTVRITAQLIDTKTDRHLWSETFDRPLTTENVFTIQDEIAQAIVNAMDKAMGVKTELKVAVAPATDNVDAYDLFLRAHQLYLARGTGLRESVLLFEQAVAADPRFARAWAELAASSSVAMSWNVLDRDYNKIALAAAERAIAIDPSLSLPYAVKGQLYTTAQTPPDFEAGVALLDKALALDPGSTEALAWRGNISAMIGNTGDAVSDYKKCLDLDPDSLICRYLLSMQKLVLGDDDDAIHDISELMLRGFTGYDPFWLRPLLQHGDRVGAASAAIAATGSAPAAAQLIEALEDPDPAQRIKRLAAMKSRYSKASGMGVYLTLQCATADPITEYRSIVQFGGLYLWLPEYRDYRKTEGFKKMITTVGISTYWRKHGFPPQCRPVGDNDFECE